MRHLPWLTGQSLAQNWHQQLCTYSTMFSSCKQWLTVCNTGRANRFEFVYTQTEQHSWITLTNQTLRGLQSRCFPAETSAAYSAWQEGNHIRLCGWNLTNLQPMNSVPLLHYVAEMLSLLTLHNPCPCSAAVAANTFLVTNQLVLVKVVSLRPLILIPPCAERLLERTRKKTHLSSWQPHTSKYISDFTVQHSNISAVYS